MPLTILIATADGPGGLDAEAVADLVAGGALGAAPDAVAFRAPRDARPLCFENVTLVLTAGTSALTLGVAARAAELGVATVVLGGSLHDACCGDRHPVGLVSYEPDSHPQDRDAGAGLRRGAWHAVEMAAGCRAAA